MNSFTLRARARCFERKGTWYVAHLYHQAANCADVGDADGARMNALLARKFWAQRKRLRSPLLAA